MLIDVWFDPGCPFTWITTRWVNRVATERDLDVRWRSFSLLVKNDPPESSPFHAKARRARDLLRVVEAARDAGLDAQLGDLYTEFGRHIHHRGELGFDVGEVLAGLSIDPSLAAATDDERWDPAIAASMDEAIGLAGADVGVPLIALDSAAGRVAFSGPVLTRVPEGPSALDLWDGFVLMTGTPAFWELKRTRMEGPTMPPDPAVPG